MLTIRAGVSLAAVVALAGCGGGSIFDTPPTPSGSTTGSIGGLVRTAAGGFSGVRIVLVNRDSTRTDATGRFVFNGLRPATYTLLVRAPEGFNVAAGESAQRAVVVPSNRDTVNVIITLQETAVGGTF